MTEGGRQGLALLTLGYLAVGLGFSIFLDRVAGAMAISWFFFGGLSAVALLGFFGWRLSKRRFVGAATLFALLLLSVLRFVELTPKKPFREFHGQLQPGMAESEVLTALAQNFPASGRYAVPTAHLSAEGELLSFTLDPTDGRYNSEVIVLAFDEGKLRSAEYLPD